MNRSTSELHAELENRIAEVRNNIGPMPWEIFLAQKLERAAREKYEGEPGRSHGGGKARALKAASEPVEVVSVKTTIEDLAVADDLTLGGALSDTRPPVGDVGQLVRHARGARADRIAGTEK